jgi:hypothetical protein
VGNEALVAILAGAFVVVVVAILGYALRSSQSPSRRVWRDDHGEVVAIGERKSTEPGRFNGRGSQLTDSVQLGTGEYRLDYWFEDMTRVALVDASGDETLFIKNEAGSELLSISTGGAYRFLVEPASETAAWSLECRPLRPPPSPAAS